MFWFGLVKRSLRVAGLRFRKLLLVLLLVAIYSGGCDGGGGGVVVVAVGSGEREFNSIWGDVVVTFIMMRVALWWKL